MTKTVEAAGGVVMRERDGVVEVLVVHRPRYDDWSLPKGKLEAGESPEAAAVREVEEETGTRCRLVRPLPRSRYVDRRGRDKTVHWWVMEAETTQPFEPNDEVDAIRWLTAGDAQALLTYDADRRLIAGVLPDGRGGS